MVLEVIPTLEPDVGAAVGPASAPVVRAPLPPLFPLTEREPEVSDATLGARSSPLSEEPAVVVLVFSRGPVASLFSDLLEQAAATIRSTSRSVIATRERG